jgi:polyferredoxin
VAPVFGYDHASYQGGWIIGGLFLLVLFLNRIRPRFWCRYLCPLGALLGLLSRVRILRLEKNEDALEFRLGWTKPHLNPAPSEMRALHENLPHQRGGVGESRSLENRILL